MNPALQKYVDDQKGYNTRLDSSHAGLKADGEAQAALIAQLQASQGDVWTPADQQILDDLQASNKAMVEKFEGLDALNPPQVPAIP